MSLKSEPQNLPFDWQGAPRKYPSLFSKPSYHAEYPSGGSSMAASQVVLYFDKQEDALRFTLAASTVMSADGLAPRSNDPLTKIAREIRKASRITTEGVVKSADVEAGSETPQRCA
jgi:hypothetical protein